MLPFGISQSIALALRFQDCATARRTRSWNWPRFRPGPSTKGDGFLLDYPGFCGVDLDSLDHCADDLAPSWPIRVLQTSSHPAGKAFELPEHLLKVLLRGLAFPLVRGLGFQMDDSFASPKDARLEFGFI